VALVAAHQRRDAAALGLRLRQQLGAVVERVRQHGRVGRHHLLPRAVGRHLVADDEAPAHRVVAALGQKGAVGAECAAAHAVGVEGQGLAPMEAQVVALDERDLVPPQQRHAAAGAHRRQQLRHGVHVHAVGLMAGQAQQHRLVAAMPLAGGAQRPVQAHLHARHLRQQALVLEPQREQPRRAHRPHRVAAARADADLEQIEHRDGHRCLR